MPSGEEPQELRIALVMNGGVSLAVWMGGVTRELDRVRRADGAYGELLRLTRARARIDVIAGASAGGINGAVLAMAIARGADVSDIRELWMDEGSIADLLRDPGEEDAPSILQGDARLLAGLREALRRIADAGTGAGPATPRHLAITGTPLEGQVTRYPDRFGSTIADVNHRALFHFRDGDLGKDGAGDRLALAARSSASFPAAFEPSFVPVSGSADETHPDMSGIADFDTTRWLIDGGVLDNTPFRPALDAIRGLPAQAPVRRVLGYVVPEPLAPTTPAAERDRMPSAREVVLDALSRLPRVQSVARELREIEENNRSVRHRREARRQTLVSTPGEELERMARALLPAYVETRRQAAVYDIAGLLLHGAGDTPGRGDVDAVRRALAAAPDAPWLPDAADLSTEPWRWGIAPVENAGNVALDLLARIVALRGIEPATQRGAMALRGMLHDFLGHLRAVQDASAAHWRDAADAIFADPGGVSGLMHSWEDANAERLGAIANGIAGVIARAAVLLSESRVRGAYADETRELARALTDAGTPPSIDGTLRRLLALDVVQRASGADLTGVEQPLELVLMSADAACSFGDPKTAAQKLAGLQFHHFGGFYKRSWRANDWMWGRLDGADRLVRTLLDPRRVQRRLHAGETAAEIADEVRAIACRGADPETTEILEGGWSDVVLHELEELAQTAGEPAPGALKATYEAIRARIQLEIVAQEIPGVVAAVREDLAAGTAGDSLGAAWARPLQPPFDAREAVDAFVGCRVAEETIKAEAGSRYFKRVSTTAAAVVGSVLMGAVPDRGLLRLPRALLARLRGVLLLVYRMRGGKRARTR